MSNTESWAVLSSRAKSRDRVPSSGRILGLTALAQKLQWDRSSTAKHARPRATDGARSLRFSRDDGKRRQWSVIAMLSRKAGEGRSKRPGTALLAALVMMGFGTRALAHGERAQEPSLRLSTIQWYDTKWSSDQISVNQELTLSGRFRVMANWPLEIPSPAGLTFLNVGVPGPVFIRTASVVNGVNGVSSMSLALGQDYEYRIVLRGRIPGRYHVHPMLDVRDTGPILGPGKWVSVVGDAATFTDPVTTLTGQRLDLARYGLGAIAGWHLVWIDVALVWLGYWLRKPLLMPRYEAVQAGN